MDCVGRGNTGGNWENSRQNRRVRGCQPAGALPTLFSARVAIWVKFGMVLPVFGRGTTADRKSLSALRGVGPEFEAGSGCFHARTLSDRALRVKRTLFGLASGGVYRAAPVASRAVRSYRTFSPLPVLANVGGLFSVALSVGLRRPGVTWHPVL